MDNYSNLSCGCRHNIFVRLKVGKLKKRLWALSDLTDVWDRTDGQSYLYRSLRFPFMLCFFSFLGYFLAKDLMNPPPPPLCVKNVKIQENSENKYIFRSLKFLRDPGYPQIFSEFLKIFTKNFQNFEGAPKKGCRGSLRVPRRSPDFFRIFLNFHIFDT